MISLHKLDHDACKQYLLDSLPGFGNYIPNVVGSEVIDEGTFYCFTPPNVDEKNFYPFQYSKSHLFTVDLNFYKLLCDFIGNFLDPAISNSRIFLNEETSSLPTDEYIIKSQRKYSLSKGVMFYHLVSGADFSEIQDVYFYVRGYGTFPMLIVPEKDESADIEDVAHYLDENITKRVCVTFREIYDGENYLVWIRNDQLYLLDVLDGCIKKYTG